MDRDLDVARLLDFADERAVGAAINFAVNVKGAVVVAAAGNTGGDCTQNPPPDPAVPADPRGWQQVQLIVSPAWYSPLVLTVGAIAPNGQPSLTSWTVSRYLSSEMAVKSRSGR